MSMPESSTGSQDVQSFVLSRDQLPTQVLHSLPLIFCIGKLGMSGTLEWPGINRQEGA